MTVIITCNQCLNCTCINEVKPHFLVPERHSWMLFLIIYLRQSVSHPRWGETLRQHRSSLWIIAVALYESDVSSLLGYLSIAKLQPTRGGFTQAHARFTCVLGLALYVEDRCWGVGAELLASLSDLINTSTSSIKNVAWWCTKGKWVCYTSHSTLSHSLAPFYLTVPSINLNSDGRLMILGNVLKVSYCHVLCSDVVLKVLF